MNGLNFKKRRAVSQVIGTMLVLAVTVAGAVFISNAAHDVFFTGVDQTPATEARVDSIILSGYDTRDSSSLTDIPTLDNQFNQLLCTSGGNPQYTITVPNNIPSNGGTEFIVLKIRNMNINSVFLHSVLINNVGHTWDSNTATNDLDASITGTAGTTYPEAGKFSILTLSNTNLEQRASNELRGDQEVRLVIKLSDQIPQDIGMWDSLRILVNFGGSQPAEFIVLSGDAKW